MNHQPRIPDLTRHVAAAAHAVRFEALPSDVQRKILDLLIDGLGVMCFGLKHPNVTIIVDYLREVGSTPASTIPGHRFASSTADAAFVNGLAIHVMDFEPMFDPPTHVVSPVLGALVALIMKEQATTGELGPEDGLRFLNAFAAGIELQADLRTAAMVDDNDARLHENFFPFQKQGFHPPGTVGVMGSALASAIWLELTVENTAIALGMAASRAGGISGNIGTMTKAAHSGNAARAGVECALLAMRGFTASASTFEEPGGWGDVFGGDFFDRPQLLEGMNTLRCFNNPGFAFKYWPAHTAMQVAIHAALPLHKTGEVFEGDIHIEAPVFKYCDRPFPVSSDEARFSFQFNVALAILDGQMSSASYAESQLRRTDLQNLLKRTALHMNHNIPADFTKMEVQVKLSDGRHASSDRWPGHWKMPAGPQQIAAKFLNCAEQLYDSRHAQALLDCLLNDALLPDFARLRQLLKA